MLPTFEDALRSFGGFLVSQGLDRGVSWVLKEDVTVRGRGTPWLRVPLPAENALLVRGLYEVAAREDSGIELSVYCKVGRLAYCSAFVPRDEEEAANRMIRGLKMTIPTRVREARLCGPGLCAGLRFVLAGRERSDWVLDEMHSRQEIRARLAVNGPEHETSNSSKAGGPTSPGSFCSGIRDIRPSHAGAPPQRLCSGDMLAPAACFLGLGSYLI